jgi:hypothetical protein
LDPLLAVDGPPPPVLPPSVIPDTTLEKFDTMICSGRNSR